MTGVYTSHTLRGMYEHGAFINAQVNIRMRRHQRVNAYENDYTTVPKKSDGL